MSLFRTREDIGCRGGRCDLMMRAAICVCSLLLPALASAQQQQQPAPSPWQRAPFSVELHAGYLTPLGFFGMAADYAPLDWLSANAGIGLGPGRHGSSARIAAGTRFRLFTLGYGRVALGLDYATGGWARVDIELPPTLRFGEEEEEEDDTLVFAERLHWLAPGVGWEARFDSALLLRLYAGLAVPLNPGDVRCESSVACDVGDGDRGLDAFAGVALGVLLDRRRAEPAAPERCSRAEQRDNRPRTPPTPCPR